MSYVSLKVKLNGGETPAPQFVDRFLLATDVPEQSHRDSVYRLSTDRLLKIRDYPDRKADIILEHVVEKDGARHSKISVGSMREGPRDSSPQDVLGEGAVTIDKKRRVFSLPGHPAVKVYVDRLSGGAHFLEFQMDIGKADVKSSVRDLKDIVLSLGFRRDDFIGQSYEAMYAPPLFEEETAYTQAYGAVSSEVQAGIRKSSTLKSKREAMLFEKGREGETALLISKGRAFVEPEGIVLKPGQLVGEFAAFTNGQRAASVISSSDFQGYIVDKPLLMGLMTEVPANAKKFLTWSQAKRSRDFEGPPV